MLSSRRAFLVNSARVAGGLVIAACAPSVSPGAPTATPVVKKDLIVASAIEVVDGQPYNQTISGSYGRVFPALYDTVIQRNAASKLAPGIATSWTTLNPTTWQFKIRSDVKFHNGDPLTPADIKWSLEHSVDPAAKTIDTATFGTIARIEVIDDTTINIVTKAPDPFMADKLAARPGFVMPSKHFQSVGIAGMNEHPIGSGPYMFKERVKGVSFTMVPNLNYWRGKPDADSITVLFRPDASARIAALKTGEVNFIPDISFDQIDDLNAHPNTKAVPGPDNGTQHYIINTLVKPLDDKRIRQALSLAIDRSLLNRTLGKGLYEIASGPIAPFEFAYDPSTPPLAYDPNRAKSLIQQAGYAGQKIILEYVPGGSGELKDQALAEQWKAVGLNIELAPMDAATRARKISNLGFLGLTSGRTASRYFDPDNVVWRALQPGGTRRYWTDPEFDRLGIEQASSTDQAVRLRNWRRMSEIMLDHMPIIYLWVEPVMTGAAKKLDITLTMDQLDDFGPGHLKFNP
jgi:peptide/nickel transport system substrate-binding protein